MLGHQTNPQQNKAGESRGASRDPFWLTSQFSTSELEGKRVWINWLRHGMLDACGVHVLRCGSHGHSRHIQWMRAEPDGWEETGNDVFDFDQADADRLRRTNERPEEYSFIADLELDRRRKQNEGLEKLVRERRIRKREDEAGAAGLEATPSS